MKTRHLLNILLLALYTSSCNKEDTPLIKTETVKIFLLSETNRIQNEDIENHEYILAKEENQVDFQEINISANINDNEHNHDYKNVTVSKTFDVTGDKSRGNVYFVDYSQDSENYRVLFQPTSKMIESIKRFNPRNVFVMED